VGTLYKPHTRERARAVLQEHQRPVAASAGLKAEY